MTAAVKMYFRPILAQKRHRNCIDSILRRVVMCVALAAINFSPASAQTLAGSQTRTAAARVEGRFPVICEIHAASASTQRADGRTEQRFTVQANVTFAIAATNQNADDIRVMSGAAEIKLAEFAGKPGFYTVIVVRSADQAELTLALEPSAARATNAR